MKIRRVFAAAAVIAVILSGCAEKPRNADETEETTETSEKTEELFDKLWETETFSIMLKDGWVIETFDKATLGGEAELYVEVASLNGFFPDEPNDEELTELTYDDMKDFQEKAYGRTLEANEPFALGGADGFKLRFCGDGAVYTFYVTVFNGYRYIVVFTDYTGSGGSFDEMVKTFKIKNPRPIDDERVDAELMKNKAHEMLYVINNWFGDMDAKSVGEALFTVAAIEQDGFNVSFVDECFVTTPDNVNSALSDYLSEMLHDRMSGLAFRVIYKDGKAVEAVCYSAESEFEIYYDFENEVWVADDGVEYGLWSENRVE